MCLVKNVLLRARAIISLHQAIVSRSLLVSLIYDTPGRKHGRPHILGKWWLVEGTSPWLCRQIMEERETLRRKLDALDTADDNMEGLELI